MNLSTDLPALDATLFHPPSAEALRPAPSTHAPRILMLYGSLRERSYSRLLTFEAARLLQALGAEVRIFDPAGLPLPDGAPDSHPKVVELRKLAAWSEGMVWTSPERHGAMTGIMKSQIDCPGSTGRRNTVEVRGRYQALEHLGWRPPAQHLARSVVEGVCHSLKRCRGVSAQIGTFGEVLAQQSVGVLVGSALPGTSRLAEERPDAGLVTQALVLGHFRPLIPGQRLA